MSLACSRARPLLLVVAVLVVAAGCTTRPTADAVSTFAVALEGASTSVKQGLGEIQRLETAFNDAAVAERFIREPDPNIQFGGNKNLTDDAIAPRVAYFDALSKYAESLAAAVSEEQLDGVRTKFAATGKAFADVGGKAMAQSGKSLPGGLAAGIAKATGGLAAVMVEEKLHREVPVIVAAVHDDLKTGVEAFKADLGDPDAGGFRAILHDSIETLVGQKKKLLLIIKSEGQTPSGAMYDAVLKAQAEVRKLRDSARLLDAIPPTLDKLLEAHEALKSPTDASARAKIQAFFERAKDLQAIASDLRSAAMS